MKEKHAQPQILSQPAAEKDGEGSKIRTLILKMSADGMSNSKIARAIHISQRALNRHLAAVDNGDLLAVIVHRDAENVRQREAARRARRPPAA